VLHDLAYLWKHRERPNSGRRLFVLLVKRTLLFLPLLRLVLRSSGARWRGAKIGRLAILGDSRIAGPLSRLQIGDECSLGRCEIALHESVVLGDKVVINDGAVLLTASHDLHDPLWRTKTGPIRVGDYCWIATNAVILPGVTIGKRAVIGAAAVVRQDVPDGAVVVGNPGVIRGERRARNLSYSPVLLVAPFEAWVGKGVVAERGLGR
jgi:acetyltransferase-like isoleucine patch superfamily enzyme